MLVSILSSKFGIWTKEIFMEVLFVFMWSRQFQATDQYQSQHLLLMNKCTLWLLGLLMDLLSFTEVFAIKVKLLT